VGPGVSSAISCPRLGSCYGRGFACRSNSRRGDGAGGRVRYPPGRRQARLPHLLFPSSMPKRRDFPPRTLRSSAEPQQFPWAEGYPVFLPIPSAGKSVRVLRGRIILELTDSAPETSGLRRQRFTLYKTLLMPAFSLPRPPGELAPPPSPANGTFHYPLPFHRQRSAHRCGLPDRGACGRGAAAPPTTEPPPGRMKNGKATTSVLRSAPLHWGGRRPRSTELLRFLLEKPPSATSPEAPWNLRKNGTHPGGTRMARGGSTRRPRPPAGRPVARLSGG